MDSCTESPDQRRPLPMFFPSSVLHFGLPTVGLFVATYVGIPALTRVGIAPMLAWYAMGLAVFIPLFITALIRSWREAGRTRARGSNGFGFVGRAGRTLWQLELLCWP